MRASRHKQTTGPRLARVFNFLLRRRRQIDTPATLPAAPVAPAWNENDRRAWAAFLASDSGQVLLARLWAVEADVAARACADVFQPAHAARHAGGFADCRKWLESISRASCDSGRNDIETAGAPSLDELYAP